MNKSIIKTLTLACLCIAGASCSMKEGTRQNTCQRYQYPCILDISVTPEHGILIGKNGSLTRKALEDFLKKQDLLEQN